MSWAITCYYTNSIQFQQGYASGYGFKSPPATNHSGVVALKKIEQ